MRTMLTKHLCQVLGQDNIRVKCETEVVNKISKFVRQGHEELQVITDFDATLTKPHANGKPTLHTIDVLNNVPSLSLEFKNGCDLLYGKYNDRAYSPSSSEEEKQQVLNLWWAEYVQLLGKENITIESVKQTTGDINTPLREGCADMLSTLSNYKIPVYVISAGIGDVIAHSLQGYETKIVANFLDVAEGGKVSGFKKPHISVYNKHKIDLPLEGMKQNVILMGDSLGDCSMADNVPNTETILKIGFVSGKDESLVNTYMDKYDIVLVNDDTMSLPKAIIDNILRR